MTAIDDRTAQATFEDSPSIGSVLTSPREFTRETLAGVVTALALIPEVISFSFISGVDPKVSLIASITLGLSHRGAVIARRLTDNACDTGVGEGEEEFHFIEHRR